MQAEKKGSAPSTPTSRFARRRSFSPKAKEAFVATDTATDMTSFMLREEIEPGVLGWQSHLAEEQMCEPEVLLMLHEYEVPLRAIFEHYARREEREQQAATPKPKKKYRRYISQMFVEQDPDDDSATQREDVDEDTDEAERHMQVSTPSFSTLPQDSQFVQADSMVPDTVMDPKDFRFMAYDLGLFPGVVQLHSVKQHVAMSLTRRNASQLSYEAFVECLVRITFVYLSIYGNNIQQAKCMWLLTLLRVRCNELKLPNGLSAEEPPEGSGVGSEGSVRFCGAAWENTTSVTLDTILLQDMVLWATINSEAPQSTRPKSQLPLATASRMGAESLLFESVL
jgi:hypothetical protein